MHSVHVKEEFSCSYIFESYIKNKRTQKNLCYLAYKNHCERYILNLFNIYAMKKKS